MASYRSIDDVLNGVSRPGWRIVGMEPQYTETTTKDPDTGNPIKTRTQTSTVWSIQSADGKQTDTMEVGEADDPNVKGGKAITVVKAPTKNLPAGNAPSTPGGWTPVYRTPGDPSSGQIGQWDPANNEFHPQAAEPGAKPSGQYTNVVDPNDPKGKRVIGMIDTGDASWHAVSSDPNLPGRQIITTPTAVYAVDADNKVSKLVDIDKDSPFQAVIVDGKPFKFDPKTGTFTAGPVNEHPDIKDQNGLTMVWQADAEGGGKYGYPPGVKPAAGLSVNTTAPNLIWYDTDGNVVATRKNENYLPTLATAPSPNTTAPMLLLPDPKDPTKLTWQENKGQVVASDALKQLASHLTGQVVDGKITVDEAKTLIDSANARMTNDINAAQTTTTAAGDILSNTRGNAQTGAGLLQQRVQAATGTLQSILGNALSNKNITSIPGDTGANLVQGLSGWTAELMGGQQTLDSAARMIQMADPSSNLADPTTQAAIGTLRQMLDKHQELTGQPHPAVVATQAAQQSQQANGFAAPPTQPVQPAPPAPVQLPQVAAGIQAPVAQVPGQNYGSNIAYTGGVPPWQQGWTAPGASYSYPGPAPWNAQPGPSFVAPPMPPPLTAAAVLGRTG